MAEAEDGAGAIKRRPKEGRATSVEDMRSELETTRHRMSRDLDIIEQRLRQVAGDLRARIDVLQPARARIRADVWGSVALAFGAGLALALLTARRSGRRGFAGEVLRSAAVQMPGAVFGGVRAGIGDALRQEWRKRGDGRSSSRRRLTSRGE